MWSTYQICYIYTECIDVTKYEKTSSVRVGKKNYCLPVNMTIDYKHDIWFNLIINDIKLLCQWVVFVYTYTFLHVVIDLALVRFVRIYYKNVVVM